MQGLLSPCSRGVPLSPSWRRNSEGSHEGHEPLGRLRWGPRNVGVAGSWGTCSGSQAASVVWALNTNPPPCSQTRRAGLPPPPPAPPPVRVTAHAVPPQFCLQASRLPSTLVLQTGERSLTEPAWAIAAWTAGQTPNGHGPCRRSRDTCRRPCNATSQNVCLIIINLPVLKAGHA